MIKKARPVQQAQELVTLPTSDYTALVARVIELEITLELKEKLAQQLKHTISQLLESE